MTNRGTQRFQGPFLALLALVMICVGRPVLGQTTATMPTGTGTPNPGAQDTDTKQWQVAAFDKFLDEHREIAEQLRNNPALVDNEEFVEQHPALQQYLQQHPGVREEIRENPNAFMRREERFDQRENRSNAMPDRDNHAATADSDQRVNDQTTIVGDRAKGDHDTTTAQMANADRFFDSHPEIAEQLRKNPALVNNEEFVEQHPALQQYLQSHPEVREEIRENPNAFMHQEQRLDQREEFGRHEDRGEMASFGGFLIAHANVAQELSEDPSLANNKEYLESHPELREYLKAHPTMQEQLTANPQTVMNSVQANNATKTSAPMPKPKH